MPKKNKRNLVMPKDNIVIMNYQKKIVKNIQHEIGIMSNNREIIF